MIVNNNTDKVQFVNHIKLNRGPNFLSEKLGKKLLAGNGKEIIAANKEISYTNDEKKKVESIRDLSEKEAIEYVNKIDSAASLEVILKDEESKPPARPSVVTAIHARYKKLAQMTTMIAN